MVARFHRSKSHLATDEVPAGYIDTINIRYRSYHPDCTTYYLSLAHKCVAASFNVGGTKATKPELVESSHPKLQCQKVWHLMFGTIKTLKCSLFLQFDWHIQGERFTHFTKAKAQDYTSNPLYPEKPGRDHCSALDEKQPLRTCGHHFVFG